eukprot:768173-Hanusia_phi.AAC.2
MAAYRSVLARAGNRAENAAEPSKVVRGDQPRPPKSECLIRRLQTRSTRVQVRNRRRESRKGDGGRYEGEDQVVIRMQLTFSTAPAELAILLSPGKEGKTGLGKRRKCSGCRAGGLVRDRELRRDEEEEEEEEVEEEEVEVNGVS